MVTLKEACEIAKKALPGYYIHCVDEFENVYLFVMVLNGRTITEMDCGTAADIVDKRTGKYEFSDIGDKRLQGDYKQYRREDLEKL